MGKDMVPKRIFLTKGVGKHKERLTSFELALRDAGIASQNLVRVSSIFPPNCKLITRTQGLKYLNHGEVVFAVVAENSTREPHRLLASSIGLAIPADRSLVGYLLPASYPLQCKANASEMVAGMIDAFAQQVTPEIIDGMKAQGLSLDDLYKNGQRITGLATHYTELDEMTSGFQRSDLIILAARPSMGKTSFAMNIAENAAIDDGKIVGIFSLEMSSEALHVFDSARIVEQVQRLVEEMPARA